MGPSTQLACARCKEKKLRCNRGDPCDRCVAANVGCVLSERKARARKARNHGAIFSLDERIRLLEAALQEASPPPSTDPESRVDSATLEGISTAGDGALLIYNDYTKSTGSDQGWLDKELLAAKSFSMDVLNDQNQATDDSPMSQAIVELDGALSELGGLSGASVDEPPHPSIPKDEAQKAIRVALESLRGEFFTSLIDLDFMMAVSSIISSPHVQVNSAVKLIYYNLLFHGYFVGGFKTQNTARTSYLQCLRCIQEWRDTATATTMDLVASSITMWTAIQNFDYDLAWEMHIQTCNTAKTQKLHLLDHPGLLSRGSTSEEFRNKQRWGFWTLVVCDLFFRLCFEKPSCISDEASPEHIQLPNLGDLTSQRPIASIYSTQTVWARVTFIAKSFFEAGSCQGESLSQEFQDQVDAYCDEIQLMLEDWRLLENVEASKGDPIQSWMYTDCLIGSLTMLLQMDKLRQVEPNSSISHRSKRAARMLLDTIATFDATISDDQQRDGLSIYSIAFWPFRAFFALYYHILSSNDPEDYVEDIHRLEKIGAILNKAARTRFEYLPIAKAMQSLNQLARHSHETRTMAREKQWDIAQASQQRDLIVPNTMTTEEQQVGYSGSEFTNTLYSQDLPHVFGAMPIFSETEALEQAAFQPGLEPSSYVQALEREIANGLWNYGWWDANANVSQS